MSIASRFALFAPQASIGEAAALAVEVFGDDEIAALGTCSVPLVQPGSSIVTLLGGSGGLAADQYSAFEESVLTSSGLVAFCWDAMSCQLTFTNHPGAASALRSDWGWETSLVAVGCVLAQTGSEGVLTDES